MEAFEPSHRTHSLTAGSSVDGSGLHVNGSPDLDQYIFVLSGKDERAAKAMISRFTQYLSTWNGLQDPGFLKHIAFTLAQRRTRFPWVVATSAVSSSELIAALESKQCKPNHASTVPRIGFVFNGQGAQWHAMGRELLTAYPVFREAILQADRCIHEFGAAWSVMEELSRDAKATRVNESMISLPLCTAIQLSLVRLLRDWGIRPAAVTSHSSGEAAAAYVAGALDFKEALATSYFRGILTTRYQKSLQLNGRMLAVGLGVDEVQPYLANIEAGKIVVACINSPSSITVSGDMEGIEQMEKALVAKRIFARKLKVGVAYHSHHMEPQRKDYLTILQQHLKEKGALHDVRYSSPVTGRTVFSAKELGPQNWVNNMVRPVLFAQSLRSMCIDPELVGAEKLVETLCELGPHSALAGPIRQTLNLPELKKHGISYMSCLERGVNAVDTMQTLVCSLLTKGYPVDLTKVNFPHGNTKLEVLSNLPSYPWNHSTSYWTESRLNKAHRHRPHPTHDLLGSRLLGVSPLTPTWRHIIRPSELPWLRDHVIQSDIVFPAAACITMAIEALRQLFLYDESVCGYLLKDIEIMNALVLSDTSEGTEVQLSFRLNDQDVSAFQNQHDFDVQSVDNDGKWTKLCKGIISVQTSQSKGGLSRLVPQDVASSTDQFESMRKSLTKELSPRRMVSMFSGVGIDYGELFQNLRSIRYGPNQALSTLEVPNVIAKMPSQYQQDHVIHPATLDAVLQASYASILSTSEPARTMIPTSIKSLFVSQEIKTNVGTRYEVLANLHSLSAHGFEASLSTRDECGSTGDPLLTIEGLFCQSIGEALEDREPSAVTKLCSTVHWKRALSLMNPEDIKTSIVKPDDPSQLAMVSDLKRAAFYLIHDAMKSLTSDDVLAMDSHHQKMHGWMKAQVQNAEKNRLDPRSSKWLKTNEGVKRDTLRQSLRQQRGRTNGMPCGEESPRASFAKKSRPWSLCSMANCSINIMRTPSERLRCTDKSTSWPSSSPTNIQLRRY